MAVKPSTEPAVAATVTAGLATAAGVVAALNAADMPAGWGWVKTGLPIAVFVVYVLTGLVIRPLVVPTAKLRGQRPAADPGGHVKVHGVKKRGGHPGGPLPPI